MKVNKVSTNYLRYLRYLTYIYLRYFYSTDKQPLMANTEPPGLRASPLVPPTKGPKGLKGPKGPKGSTNSNQWHHPSISANPTYHIISYFIPNYPFLPSKTCKGFIITNSIGKTILQLTVLVGKKQKQKNKKKTKKELNKFAQPRPDADILSSRPITISVIKRELLKHAG